MSQPRYTRLDQHDSIETIARDIVDRQAAGSLDGTSFEEAEVAAFDGFSRNGSHAAKGCRVDAPREWLDAEVGGSAYNLACAAAVTEALEALRNDSVGDREQQQMIAILSSMRDEIPWL